MDRDLLHLGGNDGSREKARGAEKPLPNFVLPPPASRRRAAAPPPYACASDRPQPRPRPRVHPSAPPRASTARRTPGAAPRMAVRPPRAPFPAACAHAAAPTARGAPGLHGAGAQRSAAGRLRHTRRGPACSTPRPPTLHAATA